MTKDEQEFLVLLEESLPDDFEKLIHQVICYESGQEINNPLYYLNNISGFIETFNKKLIKLELKNLEPILKSYTGSLNNFFQDIFLVFIHAYYQNNFAINQSINNYYNSIEEIKIYNDKILDLKYTLGDKELIAGLVFVLESLNSLVTYIKQFSQINIKRSPLWSSVFELINLFKESFNELNAKTLTLPIEVEENDINKERILHLRDCLQDNLVKNKEKFIDDLKEVFKVEKKSEIYMLINELINYRVLIIGENNKGAFYKGLKEIFSIDRLGVITGMNPVVVLHLNDDYQKKKYLNYRDSHLGNLKKIHNKLLPLLKKHKIGTNPIIKI